MNVGDVNAIIGIGAGLVGIVAGGITVKQFLDTQKSKVPSPPVDPKNKPVKPIPASPDSTPSIPGVAVFHGDDAAYLSWLGAHPTGLVINTYSKPQDHSVYMVLHKATCGSIQSRKTAAGGFTERDFIKVCADAREPLVDWAKANGRPDGSFTSECGLCKPHTAV